MLSSKLSDATDIEAVLKIAAESISHLLQTNVGCIYIGRQSEPIYIQQSGKEQIHRGVPDAEEIRKKYMDLRTEYLEEEDTYGYPVNGREHLLAVVKIDRTVHEEKLQEKKKLLHSIIEKEVLHKIREWSEVPIIIVSARDQDKEKAAALDDGADDYLTKPFSATELMARIRVALRHYYRMNHLQSEERPDDTVYVNGGGETG